MSKPIRIGYTPFPIHEGFHRTAVREKAGIGAVGSGKTIMLCGDAIGLGERQPGSRILVARQAVTNLKDTTEAEFVNILMSTGDELGDEEMSAETYYDLCKVYRLGGHIDRIISPRGTEWLFRGLDDWRKLMSMNLAGIYIDEASEISVDTYNALKTRLRQRQPTAMARKLGIKWDPARVQQVIALVANPDGHNWIWEYFINSPTPSRRFFESTSFDNPTLYEKDGTPSAYLTSLLEMPEMWVRRFVLCDHDTFEGQILEFHPDRHVFRHFEPPKDWDRAMGLDWGLRNPTAVVWWARKPGTTVWHQYREWQTYNPLIPEERESHQTMNVHEIAARIRAIEHHLDGTPESIKYRAADPAIQNRTADNAKSIEYWFSKYGLYFQLGNKDYSSRINALNQMLHTNELVLSDQCVQTSVAFQQYRWADLSMTRGDKDGSERPQKKNDHLVDASQYLATIFMQQRPAPMEKKIETFDEQVWAQVKQQVKRSARTQNLRPSRARRPGRVVH